MKFKYVSFLIAIFIVNCGSQKEKRVASSEQFEGYIALFQQKSLPLVINRDDLSDLSATVYDSIGMGYNRSKHPVISDQNRIFIPDKIFALAADPVFRAIYRLPDVNKIVPVILAMDTYVDGEQREMWLFLVTYANNGTIIDKIKIAGYEIDVIEKFLSIGIDYQITTSSYEFVEYPDANPEGYSYAIEIINQFNISPSGQIVNTQETSRKGYFEGDSKGYTFRR
jgi:hypothetical protein